MVKKLSLKSIQKVATGGYILTYTYTIYLNIYKQEVAILIDIHIIYFSELNMHNRYRG